MKQKHTFSVDAALDSIDLKFTDYTPSTDALEFFNLIRIFMGEDFEVPNPKFHYFIVDLLFGNIKREDFPYSPEIRNEIKLATSRIGILSARGSAKSTITTLFYPIYAAIKGSTPATGKLSHILILSDSQQGGSRDQSLLMGNMLNRSKFAKEWFEKIRFTESEVEVIRKGNTPVEQRHMLIKFKGANAGGIRSGSRNPVTGDRYALMIADDVIKSEADSKSEIIMRNVTTALTSDALNAMRAKKTQFIVINTPFSKKDPIYSMIESGGFTPLVTPICKEMTSNLKREDFIGLWEDMHNYDSLMERWDNAMATGSTREFNQELMLRISSEEDKLMKDEHIQEYSRKALMRNLDYYNLYMTTDLTASNSAKGDFSCVMLWAVGSNNDIFLLDLHVKKCTIAEQYEPIFDMVRTWGTRKGRNVTVGVEIDGQQQLNMHTLKKMMIEKNVFFTFARQIGSPFGKEGISRRQATGAKHEQFMRVFPLFQQHKIHLPEELKDSPDMKEVMNELNYITYNTIGSKHDDCGTYHTKVDTPTGYKLLGEIVDGDDVIGYGPLGSVVCKVKDARITGIKPIINIEMEDGTVLRFSEFHPMLTDTGYKLVKDIAVGSKLVRNKEWKQQLNTQDISGVESLQVTINQQQDAQMEVEKIGCINMYMKKLMDQYHRVMTYIIEMRTNPITVLVTWSYLLWQSIKKNTWSKIGKMGLDLVNMSKNTLMKCKDWLSLGRKGCIQEEPKEKNWQEDILTVNTVEKASYLIIRLEQILSTVVQHAEMLGIELPRNLQNAVTVENYSRLLVNMLRNVQNAELQADLKQLTYYTGKYVKSAEIRSKVLLDKLTAEKNAQELAKIEWQEKDVKTVKKIWITKPEPTYNFEIEEYHNYQVEDGYVVHNCLDAISMLASMEMIAPSMDLVMDNEITSASESIWGDFDNSSKVSSSGSTVF